MILVDTSVWVYHLNRSEERLQALLEAGEVSCHPFVIGELAVGNLRPREEMLRLLQYLPSATVATEPEMLRFISEKKLYGVGIGYVDIHLLLSVLLSPESLLWTRDKRLAAVADALKITVRISQARPD